MSDSKKPKTGAGLVPNPAPKSGKASPKARSRQRRLKAIEREALEQAFRRVAAQIDRSSQKAAEDERKRREALAETVDLWLEQLAGEEVLEDIFVALEVLATATNRRRIATHPSRPAGVEVRVEAILAAEAAQEERGAEDGAAEASREA